MANEKRKNTAGICEDLARPVAEQMGILLWDTTFEKEGAGWYLRYLIDTENGISIDECEAFSREMSSLLDREDPISQSYTLEVGSPGIERKLTKGWHFERYKGADILVRLIRPVEGIRDFVGTLLAYDEEQGVTIRLDDEIEMTFGLDETAYVRLYVEF